jgi:BlaI family transcriptional regulator, penicillinase repressor
MVSTWVLLPIAFYFFNHPSIINFSKNSNIILATYVFNTYLWFMDEEKDIVKEFWPTKTELDVLQVLWQTGPQTVRFVHNKLNEQKEIVQYTSTLKLMQVMKEKGMLERDETNMKHIYSAAIPEQKVKGNLLGRFVDSMFNGSSSSLMMALLENDKTSAEELEKIKELLGKMK